MHNIGRIMLIAGVSIAAAGLIFILAGKLNIPLGRLPGDITYQKKNFTVFAPFGTMLVVSLIIALILNIISRWKH